MFSVVGAQVYRYESSDDEAQNRFQSEDQHALDTPITNTDIQNIAQAGVPGNIEVIDLTNCDSVHDQLTTGVPDVSAGSRNVEPDRTSADPDHAQAEQDRMLAGGEHTQADDPNPTSGIQGDPSGFSIAAAPPLHKPRRRRPPSVAAAVAAAPPPAADDFVIGLVPISEDLPPPTFQEPEFPVNLVGARRLDASKHEASTSYRSGFRWNKNHPSNLVIDNPTAPLRTRGQMIDEYFNYAFISHTDQIGVQLSKDNSSRRI
ncbi:protein phosphatase 2a, regulatory subunit [Dorcoceras hygrometricum]|uniref:Protein phosphatase 2a, regulatory subunit n=1 Tax=Dorcoceras hygrometricum TaxID=472368 RepID=A0A2Z7BPB0_9LAMI|nr:protein phosphatase 2a, regulatory subunit [Dorcoceras hygrometricum]